MKEKLKGILLYEKLEVEEMLNLMDIQYRLLLSGDPLEIQNITTKLDQASRKIAKLEISRRELLQGKEIKTYIHEENDEELDSLYRRLKQLVQLSIYQKDTNEVLLKQSISYTSRIIGILNPDRTIKTYNAYGRVGR